LGATLLLCRKADGTEGFCGWGFCGRREAGTADDRVDGETGKEMTTVSEKIDAKLVKELREKSGAPMGDCLKALQ
jgi:hypothetical protein